MTAPSLTKDEQAIIIDSLVVMLGIALSRSAALKHHQNVKQSEYFAEQCRVIRALLSKLEGMWPIASNQTTLKF